MAKYKIDPKGLFDHIANLNEKQRASFVLKLAVRMVNGETFSSKWIVKEKGRSKKSLGNYTEEFLTFWKFYPKKVGKGAAFAVWSDLAEDLGGELLQAAVVALNWQIDSDQWTKENGQFIPNPETYLRQRRFEDEPISSTTTKIEKAY